ncbi:hypothetical protein [Haloterrigena alkaliphila]|uniref:Uncharacterized protein n=1 Tax=Haloterrigena alkaliphila TaxID=2816475 RepID=A0A8A2VRZ2_9EURY|nr:hypothetical protein [Haloterrigena alkaliphila]QSX00809.1 hypothetical protein J0X25_07585 [Haloterrigena alkaliphila]
MTTPIDRPDSTGTPASPDRNSGLVSRRTFVAAGGTAALTSLAGCSALVDFVADFALKEVNVFNGASRPVNGTVEIVDPAGDVVFEESFALAANKGDDGAEASDDESAALYDDVWTETGDYEVSVELEERLESTSSDDGDAENGTDTNSTAEENGSAEQDSADTGASGSGTSATDTVTIENTEEERLVIGLAQDDPDELIGFHVIEDLSDLEDESNQSAQ